VIGESWVDGERSDVFGQITVGGGEIPALDRHYAFEGFEFAKLFGIGAGEAGRTFDASLVHIQEVDLHDAVGVAVGVRVDEDGVDDGEDGGGGADAEGEREDGGEGECGAFAEFAEGVAEVGVHASLVSGDGYWKCWRGVGLSARGSQVRDPLLRRRRKDGANVGLEQVEKQSGRDGGAE
jgi:hypothetical protein